MIRALRISKALLARKPLRGYITFKWGKPSELNDFSTVEALP
jgi:hypothetical protein